MTGPPSAGRRGPGGRLLLVGLGVLALLAVVALASRGRLQDGGGAAPSPPRELLDYGFSVFLVLYVISIPFTLWLYFVQRRVIVTSGAATRRRGGLVTNLAVLLGFVAAAVLLVGIRQARGDRPPLQLPPLLQPKEGLHPKGRAEPQAPEFRWGVVVAFCVLGAAGVGAYFVLRTPKHPLRGRALPEELALALDDAIDDVRAESDPRRAVIKAYARLEAIMAAHGLPRDPAEAPFEYLARTLETLRASAASVERLTALFERAKFSLHEIDVTMREEAIEALRAVRDELRQDGRAEELAA